MSLTKESLRKLYLELDQEMRGSFDRSLPFDEYILDRFERAQACDAGPGSSIHHLCYIYGKIKIGKNTWVGPFTLLDGSGELSIGDNCSISAGVHIYSHDTVQKRISHGKSAEKAPVTIGDSCYIGPQAVIAKGVKLGDFTIVGANSFVSKSFSSHSVVMGSPAVLRGKIQFDSSGSAFIEWIPKIDLGRKIEVLEKRIQELERRIGSIEKI